MKIILHHYKTLRLYILVTLVLLATMAGAAVIASTLDIRWDPPSERVDGSILPISEIKQFNVYVNDSFYSSIDGQEKTAGISVTGPGQYCITMTTVDYDDRESVLSNEKCFTIEKANPKAPVLISIGLSSI